MREKEKEREQERESEGKSERESGRESEKERDGERGREAERVRAFDWTLSVSLLLRESSSPKKLLACGFSTPYPVCCLICTRTPNCTLFPIFSTKT